MMIFHLPQGLQREKLAKIEAITTIVVQKEKGGPTEL